MDSFLLESGIRKSEGVDYYGCTTGKLYWPEDNGKASVFAIEGPKIVYQHTSISHTG